MHALTIRLLGEFSATNERGETLEIGNKRAQRLLIYLALRGEQGAFYADIAEYFAGDVTAVPEARELVHELQVAMRPLAVLVTAEDGVRIDLEQVWVDALKFDEASSLSAVNRMREATDLYRGNLLEDFPAGSVALDQWLADRRLNYWRSSVSVFGRLLAAQIKAGWWQCAVDTASRLLSLDPSQEVVHRTLMRLQLEQGRPDSALRRYQECTDILRREFGRSPSAETKRVHEDIMTALARQPAPREAFRNPFDGPVLILLLEDDLVSSALVEGYLVEAGYEVITVADGADALLEIGRTQFDLLLLDINVPTLSGLRLFEVMIQKGIETPAIFITGVAGAEAEARSLEMGAADFLRKPVRKETLLPRIRAILQRKQRIAAGGPRAAR